MHFKFSELLSVSENNTSQKLLSRDFILLFCMTMFINSYIAVFYCFEQWLVSVNVSPNFRGILISALYGMILFCRPLVSIFLLGKNMFFPTFIAIIVASVTMLGYAYVSGNYLVEIILFLRIIQGIALAVYSCCTVSILVNCIPKGQSARGFALFSLTLLLPYSIIPAISEYILPLVGGEANLFGLTAILSIPSLIMLILLHNRFSIPAIISEGKVNKFSGKLWNNIRHSGLLYIYLSCLMFSIMTVQAIFFMKGLGTITGANSAWFFTVYTITIMVIRTFGGAYLDSLPRYKTIILCSICLAICVLGFAFGPLWSFIPFSCIYGVALSLLYPLLAAIVYDRSDDLSRPFNSNIMMSCFDTSGLLAPILGSYVIHIGFGYQGVFVGCAISVSLCGVCTFFDSIRHFSQRSRLSN